MSANIVSLCEFFGVATPPAEARTLPVEEIVQDKRLQVRLELSWGAIERYTSALRSEAQLPPVTVALIGGAHVLMDGWHRIAAAKRVPPDSGPVTVEAFVIEGLTIEDAALWAGMANTKHGLPLRREEKRRLFRAYIKAGKHRKGKNGLRTQSAREVARGLEGAIDHKTVLDWAEKDFPAVWRAMAQGDGMNAKPMKKQKRDPNEFLAGTVRAALEQAFHAGRGVTDDEVREALVLDMRLAADALEAGRDTIAPTEDPNDPSIAF